MWQFCKDRKWHGSKKWGFLFLLFVYLQYFEWVKCICNIHLVTGMCTWDLICICHEELKYCYITYKGCCNTLLNALCNSYEQDAVCFVLVAGNHSKPEDEQNLNAVFLHIWHHNFICSRNWHLFKWEYLSSILLCPWRETLNSRTSFKMHLYRLGSSVAVKNITFIDILHWMLL